MRSRLREAAAALRPLLASPLAAYGIVVLGVVLRAVQYAANRSLWMDEAFFALNLTDYSLADLLLQTDYELAVPAGFLAAVDAATGAFGTGEFALRLVPFLCSLVGLGGFLVLVRRELRPSAALIALFLFAVTPSLIYYASELRPYGCDATVAVLLLLVGRWVDRRGVTAASAASLAAAGLVALFVSFPAAFMVAGIGLALLSAHRHDRASVVKLVGVGAVWAAGFAALYVFYVSNHGHSDASFDLWGSRFLAAPGLDPRSWPAAIERTAHLLTRSLSAPLGFILSGLGAVLLLAGLVALRKQRTLLMMIGLPVLITIAASFLRLYPFYDRVLLFLVPSALLLAGAGAAYLTRRLPGALVPAALLALILVPPFYSAAMDAVRAPFYYLSTEEARPLLADLAERLEPDDALYVYPLLEPHVRYYAPRIGLDTSRVRYLDLGRTDRWNRTAGASWQTYLSAIADLRHHPRVWVVFYPLHDPEARTLSSLAAECLLDAGHLTSRIATSGLVAYRFEFPPGAAAQPFCEGSPPAPGGDASGNERAAGSY